MPRSISGLSPIVLGLVLFAAHGVARADFDIPSNALEPGTFGIEIESSTLMPVGDPINAIYLRLFLTPNAVLKSGNFITLYDIPGIGSMLFTSTPETWTSRGDAFNPSPLRPFPFPDTSITNVTFRYLGDTIDNSQGTSSIFLGIFAILTEIEYTVPAPPILTQTFYYLSSTTNPDPSITTPVISFGGTTPSLVPEPASLILMAAGLPAALFLRRRRRVTA
jgi:hypothetical protein